MDFELTTTTSPRASERASRVVREAHRQKNQRQSSICILSAASRSVQVHRPNMGRPGPLAFVLPLWMSFGCAAASGLHEPQICYVLDGILFVYGLVLTTLYCRLKVISCKKASAGKPKEDTGEGIYSDLAHPADTYEVIGMKT